MIHGSVQSSCAEVVCLFCGHHTTALVVMSGISLVRCRLCGREAPYPAGEIVTFEPAANDCIESYGALRALKR